MSEDEQAIAIAEHCIPGMKGPYGCYTSPQLTGWVDGDEWVIPNYLDDLNAMHDAEKTLKYHECLRFVSNLRQLCSMGRIESWDFGVISTPAKVRAEAFLRAIGKWQDARP